MNAIGAPAQTGIDDPGAAGLDRRDPLRLVGGMMFAAGALVLLIRKGNEWSNWAIFFGLLIPAAALYAIALADRARAGVQGWRSAFLVFATLLLPAALLQLVKALDGTPSASLNVVWVFGLTAAVAVFVSFSLRAPVQMLLGAIALLVAWLALWDKILSNPTGDTVRWLLIVIAAIFVAGAIPLTRARRPQGSDLVTVAGLAAVLAGALSLTLAAASLSSSLGSVGSDAPKPGQGWNVFLLVVSLALIAYGSRSATRGPAYIGAIGLASFIAVTGIDLVSRLKGGGGGVVGWPLVLLIGGGLALVLSFVLKPGGLGGAGPGGQAGYAAPGAVPPAQAGGPVQPQSGQPGSLLDQWRQQPPPGPEQPPQQ
jgi:hypothetical protein